jgi:pimeloyl-ACP methyl ester carboxylesterase
VSLRLEPIIDGNASGPTIVFIQGWPDDASLWDEAVAAVKSTYRCVRVTLPNYDGHRSARWGYSTDEIVDALSDVVKRAAESGPVTLVLHDWGCYWGHAVHHRHPELVSRVAGFDVAPHFQPSAVGALGIVAYQSWLGWAFALGGPVGNWMTRTFAKTAHVPHAGTRWLDSSMNYPYRNIWLDIASGRVEKLTRGYYPKCPILFAYGRKKPFMFHSDKWIDHVKSVGGEVVALPADHWVMRDRSFVDTLVGWLDRTRA